MSGALSAFGQSLKDADMGRVEVEREQLALERERHCASIIERKEERAERIQERKNSRKRSEERKAQFDMEMTKFIEMLTLIVKTTIVASEVNLEQQPAVFGTKTPLASPRGGRSILFLTALGTRTLASLLGTPALDRN